MLTGCSARGGAVNSHLKLWVLSWSYRCLALLGLRILSFGYRLSAEIRNAQMRMWMLRLVYGSKDWYQCPQVGMNAYLGI